MLNGFFLASEQRAREDIRELSFHQLARSAIRLRGVSAMLAALSSFGSWAKKRKRLLAGVVGVAVKSASACVPGVSLAADVLGQLAEKATEDILDPDSKQP